MSTPRRERALTLAAGRPLLSADLATVTWLTGLVTDIEYGPSPFSAPPAVVLDPDGSLLLVVSEDEAAGLSEGIETRTFPGFAVEDVERPAAVSRLVLEAVGNAAAPLSNLDARLRLQMRAEIARIQHELGATTIYVTHDQVEAMTMGDRVAVLRKGVLQQTDRPQHVYDAPANLFVASFIGSPAMNLVEAMLEERNGGFVARVGTQAVELPADVAAARPGLAGYAGRKIGLGIRPEHMREAGRDGLSARLRGNVVVSEALGAEELVHIEVDAVPVVTQEVLEVAGDMDAAVVEELQAEAQSRRTTLVARFETASGARVGEPVEVSFAPEKAHFFDLENGTAIRS